MDTISDIADYNVLTRNIVRNIISMSIFEFKPSFQIQIQFVTRHHPIKPQLPDAIGAAKSSSGRPKASIRSRA